jgi:hypothetical protein
MMQCARRCPPWPTGSADGPHLGRVVASGEAGVAAPGWVRGGAALGGAALGGAALGWVVASGEAGVAGPGWVGGGAALGGALGWVVASGEAGVAGPGWVRGRAALALVHPSRPRPGWVGDRSTLARVVIFGSASVAISSVAVPTSRRHRASLSPVSCVGPAPSAERDHQPADGQDDQRRADQIRLTERRARCRGRGRAWLGWPIRRRQGGRRGYGRQRTELDSGAGRVGRQSQDPARIDRMGVFKPSAVGLKPPFVQVEDLQVPVAVAEGLGRDHEKRLRRPICRRRDDVELNLCGRPGGGRRTARGGGNGPEAVCGRGRACPQSGEGCGDDQCRRADMRGRPQQASCGAAGTPAEGHCLRHSSRHVRTACAFLGGPEPYYPAGPPQPAFPATSGTCGRFGA